MAWDDSKWKGGAPDCSYVRLTNRVVSVGASRVILALLLRPRACGNSLLD